jgi:hypothetical protein
MVEFFTVDLAIGIMSGCALWAFGDYIYRRIKGQSSADALSGLKSDAKGIELKTLNALALGTKTAITTVRQEAAVKLSEVESVLHDRLVKVETALFGANYSAATTEAAAKAAADNAVLAAKLKSDLAANATQAAKTTPSGLSTSAAAVAATAIAGLGALSR